MVAIGDLVIRNIYDVAAGLPLLVLKMNTEEILRLGARNVYAVSGSLPKARLSQIRMQLQARGFGNDGIEVRLSGKSVGQEGCVVLNRLFEGKPVATLTYPAEMCILLNKKVIRQGTADKHKLEKIASQLSCAVKEV